MRRFGEIWKRILLIPNSEGCAILLQRGECFCRNNLEKKNTQPS